MWPRAAAQHSNSASLCLSQSPSVLDAMCTEDADCPMGNPVVHGNGTGCFAKKNIKSFNSSCLVANRSTKVPDCPSSVLFVSVHRGALQPFILGSTLQRPVTAGQAGAAGTRCCHSKYRGALFLMLAAGIETSVPCDWQVFLS